MAEAFSSALGRGAPPPSCSISCNDGLCRHVRDVYVGVVTQSIVPSDCHVAGAGSRWAHHDVSRASERCGLGSGRQGVGQEGGSCEPPSAPGAQWVSTTIQVARFPRELGSVAEFRVLYTSW